MAVSNPNNIFPVIGGGFVQGAPGKDGANGLSTYEIAVKNGYDGTESEWLESIAGANGLSAYEIAVKNGYVGPVLDWLDSLIGPPGVNGNDGKDGKDGLPGKTGKSAYRIAVENGFDGTIQDWLDSLHLPIEGDIPVKAITRKEYAALSAEEKNSRTLWIIVDGKPRPATIYEFENGLSTSIANNIVSVSVNTATDFDGDNTRPPQTALLQNVANELGDSLLETKEEWAINLENVKETWDSKLSETKEEWTTDLEHIKDNFAEILGDILSLLQTV